MKRLWIIGSGKRVVETALPVLEASTSWKFAGIASRKAKRIATTKSDYDVTALDELTRERLAGTNLVYLVVAKPAVPEVLQRIGPLVPADCELLIETPVMLFKHLGHLHRLDAFRRTWVSEDCSTLPCWDPLLATGARFRSASFDRSAYAYHGIAMARALLGGDRVASARRTKDGRELRFTNDARLRTVEPRDYRVGRLRVEADQFLVADHDPGEPHRRLTAQVEGDRLVGFALDDDVCELDATERAAAGAAGEGDGLFRWMDAMKRVGFLRLLERLAAGEPAYSLEHALEDAVVDYWLHRAKRYRATPFTDPRSALARLSYRALTTFAG